MSLLDKPNTVRDFPGLQSTAFGVREPRSRLLWTKLGFVRSWVEAWLPPPKRQHGWRTPKVVQKFGKFLPDSIGTSQQRHPLQFAWSSAPRRGMTILKRSDLVRGNDAPVHLLAKLL